jgi:uncharacterized membrane protein
MTEKINLSEYKRQIFLFYSEDGLADLAVGLMIFGFGIMLLADLPALVGLLGIVSFLVWYFGKQTLVIPRVGSIQPGEEIRKRFLGFFVNLLIMGIGVLVFFLVNRRAGYGFLASSPLALFGLVLALAISALGLMIKASRFYLYGLLVFVAMALGEWLGKSISAVDPFLVAVISAGALILGAGGIVLARFLKKYPVLLMEG